MTKRYLFGVRRNESHWDTIRRLADEVGWSVTGSRLARWRLQRRHTPIAADRSTVTRAEFVQRLVGDAGRVRFFSPDGPAR